MRAMKVATEITIRRTTVPLREAVGSVWVSAVVSMFIPFVKRGHAGRPWRHPAWDSLLCASRLWARLVTHLRQPLERARKPPVPVAEEPHARRERDAPD